MDVGTRTAPIGTSPLSSPPPLLLFVPRRNSSRVLIRRLFVATAGTSEDPVPPIREFYGSLVGSAEKILEEITTLVVGNWRDEIDTPS